MTNEDEETDMHNENLNHILICLGVIGAVEEYDMLTWDASGSPNIQRYGPFRPVRRYWTNQSRYDNIRQLNTVIYNAIEIFSDDEDNSTRIKPALLNSTHGLKNLMKTYKDDQLVVQALSVMHENIINLENHNL